MPAVNRCDGGVLLTVGGDARQPRMRRVARRPHHPRAGPAPSAVALSRIRASPTRSARSPGAARRSSGRSRAARWSRSWRRGSASVAKRRPRPRAFARRAIAVGGRPLERASAAIVTAIVIGDRTGLDDEVERRLQEAGTYHVIAISGGNIAILAGLTLGRVPRRRLPRPRGDADARSPASSPTAISSAAARRSIARR